MAHLEMGVRWAGLEIYLHQQEEHDIMCKNGTLFITTVFSRLHITLTAMLTAWGAVAVARVHARHSCLLHTPQTSRG